MIYIIYLNFLYYNIRCVIHKCTIEEIISFYNYFLNARMFNRRKNLLQGLIQIVDCSSSWNENEWERNFEKCWANFRNSEDEVFVTLQGEFPSITFNSAISISFASTLMRQARTLSWLSSTFFGLLDHTSCKISRFTLAPPSGAESSV